LFDRSKRAIQLTAAGKYFYRDTTEIFKALERAKRNVASSSTGQSGALKVGFMMSSAYNILPAVTRHYSAAYPEVDMRLSEYVPNLLATDIEDEKIDVGIMYRPEDCRRLDSHTIYAEPLLAVLPRGHRLAHKPEISAAELAEDAFISIPRPIAPVVYDLIQQHCQLHGFRPRIVLETNLQQTIVNLVGEGLGGPGADLDAGHAPGHHGLQAAHRRADGGGGGDLEPGEYQSLHTDVCPDGGGGVGEDAGNVPPGLNKKARTLLDARASNRSRSASTPAWPRSTNKLQPAALIRHTAATARHRRSCPAP
jgi:hypothetical protein